MESLQNHTFFWNKHVILWDPQCDPVAEEFMSSPIKSCNDLVHHLKTEYDGCDVYMFK